MLNEDMQESRAVCDKHGEYKNSRTVFGRTYHFSCPRCVEEKQAAEEAAALLKRKEAEEEKKRREWQEAIETSEIPIRFQNRTLETYVASADGQQRALSAAMAYANDFEAVYQSGRSMILVGKPGTGKTHLSIGIALHVMRAGYSARYTTVMRAIRRVKDTWSANRTETDAQAIKALVWPDLLILDEVGVQFGSETERLILFEIMNGRYEQRMPTILLSNLPTNELTSFLGERVMDRLREDGAEVFVFDWESYRRSSAT